LGESKDAKSGQLVVCPADVSQTETEVAGYTFRRWVKVAAGLTRNAGEIHERAQGLVSELEASFA
jgi:hypothetical protein